MKPATNQDENGLQPRDDAPAGRLLSLDVFRGLTIALMIIVNNPGDGKRMYSWLGHAAWNGWSGADIVFPFFLFIMGMSLSLSLSARSTGPASRTSLVLKILRRSLILVTLGLLLNLGPSFSLSHMRIPGVLQRIGLCYFFASLAYLFLKPRARTAFTAGLLLAYGAALVLIRPYDPENIFLDPMHNLCRYVDSAVLGGHTYAAAPAAGFDPEGILSTIPAIATTLIGSLIGTVTQPLKSPGRRISLLFLFGALLVIAGILLDNWIPINKNLWTPSYALFMSGLAVLTFLFCHFLLEIRRWTLWSRPFLVLGLNAIAVYFLSSALAKFLVLFQISGDNGLSRSLKSHIFESLFSGLLPGAPASLLYSLGYLALWIMLIYVSLHRRGIIIKI